MNGAGNDMGGTGRHGVRERARLRLGTTTAVAVLVAVTAIAAAVLAARQAPSRATALAAPAPAGGTAGGTDRRAAGRAAGPVASAQPAGSLVLTAADHRDCPAGATACVDLTRHITWLQAGGTVTFGPVQMEPGRPGSQHQTPRGTFDVAWKAGPDFMSSEYNEPMPWATFFAAGGIAFHGGSLTEWSHGCVHLTVANARYYNEHLPIGAEVVVF
jgi:L,D-transpeptidase catalytic domain